MSNKLIAAIKEFLDQGKTYRIVFIGDSTTSNEWVHPNWREIMEYVIKDSIEKQISEWQKVYWDLRFINCGMNGAGTQDFLDYIHSEVLGYKPNLVICMGGDNDVEMDVPPKAHAENINQIRQILSQTVDNFVFATQIASLDDSINQEYQEYLKGIEITPYGNEIFIDLFSEYEKLDRKQLFTFRLGAEEAANDGKPVGSIDPLHPNIAGQAEIARIMLKQIFSIKFDPTTYLTDVLKGKKYPVY